MMKHAGEMTSEQLKKIAFDAIDAEHESIIRLSRYINEHPETAYKEKKASGALKDFLSKRGFEITAPAGGLETAFVADFMVKRNTQLSSSDCPVALIAEYDALEGIGHGCGHNLVAAAAAAAAIGLAAAVDSAGLEFTGIDGSLFRVIGSPAEETMTEAAGKNRLIKAGVFEGVGSCLMFHPWIKTGVAKTDLGCTAFRIVFSGRPAHAAADPWNGLNALDAAVTFYNSISMLRQQLPSGFKLHCIIPEGGTVLNIIPDRTVVEVMLRSTELEALNSVEERLRDCAEAAGTAAGCSVEVSQMAAVKPILFNQKLFDIAAENSKSLGESLETLPIWEASSDFGDVSREIPAMSLLYKTHDEQTCWHSAEAAAEAHTSEANEAMLRAAKILTATAIDLIYAKDL